MFRISNNIDSIVQKIKDYQRYVILNRSFIRELEAEGGETSELLKDIAAVEAKLYELKLRCRNL